TAPDTSGARAPRWPRVRTAGTRPRRHFESVLARDGEDRIEIPRLAVETDRQNRFGARSGGRLALIDVDRERLRIDVHEPGTRARVADHSHRHEGERNRDDFGAGTDAAPEQRQVQPR